MIRKTLKERIRNMYGTQDRCAYALSIQPSVLSRIINCTCDPTAEQLEILCKDLILTKEEVVKKDE